MFRAQRGSTQQSATAHGSKQRVQLARFFQQFFCGRRLPGDDSVVVIRMNHHRAGFCLYARCGFISCRYFRFAKSNFPAIRFDSLAFHRRRILRHHNPCRNSAPRRRTGNRCRMIAARMRHDSARSFLVTQRKYRVGRATNFERSGLLQVLAFEKQFRTAPRIECRRPQHRRSVYPWHNSRMCRLNGIPRRLLRL